MVRKVYVYPADSYLGRSLCLKCQEQGYEVLGGYQGSEAPSYLSTSYQIGSIVQAAAQRQFLATADVVIYEMFGHEQAARDAVVSMAKQPFGGRQQMFIGVSTPLVWAATRPAPPEEEIDVPDSASDLIAGDAADNHSTTADGDHQQDKGRALSRPTSGAASRFGSTKSAPTLDAYAAAAALGALTDKDAWRRAPCLRVREVHELEQLVVRCQRKGKVRTAVVCPGLMYGQGEADEGLHVLMRTAWELENPLKIYGSGNNHLPMIHVDDCAAYITALCGGADAPAPSASLLLMAGLPDAQQYLLAVDCTMPGHPGGVQQEVLVKAIAERLGAGSTQYVPSDELLFLPDVERWTLNTPLACSPLPPAARYAPKYSDGVLAHIDAVLQQWKDVRAVNPLRIVLAGAPMAGKSIMAARLAQLYKLPMYDAKTLLTNVDRLSPEDAKTLATEMSGKEGRASAKSMAALLRAVLTTNKTAVNRGYVLDAIPKTAGLAKWAFMKPVPMTSEEISEKGKDEAAMRAASPSKGAKGAAPAKKDAKGKGTGDDGPDVAADQKLVVDMALAPTHVIEVVASAEQMAGRRVAAEAAEQAAIKSQVSSEAAAAPSKPAAKGGAKDKAGPVSHNNEKDYARRQAIWAQIQADQQTDLDNQITASKNRWERQQAEREAEHLRTEAEARTLRARRRKAREEAALFLASGTQQSQDAAQSGSLTSTAMPATAGLPQQLGETAGADHDAPGTTSLADEKVAEPEQPPLPKYGGLLGVLVGGCGAEYLQIKNPDQVDGPPVVPESWLPGQGEEDEVVPPALAPLEDQLRGFLGSARNFEGMVQTIEMGQVLSTGTGSRSNKQKAQPAPVKDAALEALLEKQTLEAERQAQASLEAKYAAVAEPVRRYIMANVMPTVTEALRLLCVNRSGDPVRFLAQHLIETAEELESFYIDPYTDPSYEVQRQKLVDKQARDNARALAAKEKEEKELAAKAAAKQASVSPEPVLESVLAVPVPASPVPAAS